MDPNKQEKVRVFNKLTLINIEMNEKSPTITIIGESRGTVRKENI